MTVEGRKSRDFHRGKLEIVKSDCIEKYAHFLSDSAPSVYLRHCSIFRVWIVPCVKNNHDLVLYAFMVAMLSFESNVVRRNKWPL